MSESAMSFMGVDVGFVFDGVILYCLWVLKKMCDNSDAQNRDLLTRIEKLEKP